MKVLRKRKLRKESRLPHLRKVQIGKLKERGRSNQSQKGKLEEGIKSRRISKRKKKWKNK